MVNLQGFALLIETRYPQLVQRRVHNENLILLKLTKSTIMSIIVLKKILLKALTIIQF